MSTTFRYIETLCSKSVIFLSLSLSGKSALPSHGSRTVYRLDGVVVAHPIPDLYIVGLRFSISGRVFVQKPCLKLLHQWLDQVHCIIHLTLLLTLSLKKSISFNQELMLTIKMYLLK